MRQTTTERNSRREHGLVAGLVLVAFLLSCPATTATDSRILDIRPLVLTTGTQVRLEELVTDASILSKAQREEIVIEQVPAAGALRQLTLIEIAYRLQRCPDLLTFQLRGPKSITIQGGGDPAFLRQCKRDVTKQFEKTAPWDNWNASIRFTLDDERRLGEVRTGYTSIVLKPRDTTTLLGSVALDVVFSDPQGEVLSQCTITPTILREVKALMTTEGFDRGHVLRASDVRETSVWMGADQQLYVTDDSMAIGHELNRRLSSGELLRPSHLAPPMCVERGEMVRVRCQVSSMTITLNALAIDGGRLGDTVRLRNPTSEATFRAILTGRKSASLVTQ